MKISIKGGDQIIASFNASKDILHKAVSEGLETSAKIVQQRSRRKVGSPPTVNTGELARSINYKSMGKLSIRVGADAKYAPFVEYGRGAGRMPPVAPIERWAQTKLGARGAGFAIARKIARRGTKPQPYFFPAVEQSLAEIKRVFEQSIAKFVKAL